MSPLQSEGRKCGLIITILGSSVVVPLDGIINIVRIFHNSFARDSLMKTERFLLGCANRTPPSTSFGTNLGSSPLVCICMTWMTNLKRSSIPLILYVLKRNSYHSRVSFVTFFVLCVSHGSSFIRGRFAKRPQPLPDEIETFLLEARGPIGSVVNTNGEIGVHFTKDEMHDLSLATKKCRDTNFVLRTELKKARNALHDLLYEQVSIRSLIDQIDDKDDTYLVSIYVLQVKRLEAITRNLSESIQTPDKKKV